MEYGGSLHQKEGYRAVTVGSRTHDSGGPRFRGIRVFRDGPNLAGSKWLRHLGLANVSYLAPVPKGLTVQGGIFPSLIGYDALYSKDNLSYTRPWGADFTPYLMMGVNASYPLNEKLTGTLFAVTGYWHLANANSVPSSGEIARIVVES